MNVLSVTFLSAKLLRNVQTLYKANFLNIYIFSSSFFSSFVFRQNYIFSAVFDRTFKILLQQIIYLVLQNLLFQIPHQKVYFEAWSSKYGELGLFWMNILDNKWIMSQNKLQNYSYRFPQLWIPRRYKWKFAAL